MIAEYDRVHVGAPGGARKIMVDAPAADVVSREVLEQVEEHGIPFGGVADVVAVRYGAWLQTTEPLGAHDVDCVECSACGESWVLDEEFDFDVVHDYWNYCPNCGADMIGAERREQT